MEENELLKQHIANLEDQIKLLEKRKPVQVNDFQQTLDNPMSNTICVCLDKISKDTEPVVKLYKRIWSFANYAIICGIGGTTVNYIVLSTTMSFLPLIIADVLAILSAAIWNYTLTVGSLGYLTGLAPKKIKNDEWSI